MPSRDHKFVGLNISAIVTTHALLIALVKLAGVGIEAAGVKACRRAVPID